jgi:hypothetical protein
MGEEIPPTIGNQPPTVGQVLSSLAPEPLANTCHLPVKLAHSDLASVHRFTLISASFPGDRPAIATAPAPGSTRPPAGEELSLAELMAAAMPPTGDLPASGNSLVDQRKPHLGAVDGVEIVEVATSYDPDPKWLLSETEALRRPLFRTERSDKAESPGRASFTDITGDGQAVFAYRYDAETEMRSTLGELNCRDMLVMTAIQQAFYAAGCPASGLLTGPPATLYHLARQVGLSGGEATNLVKASLARLHQAKVTIRFRSTEKARKGGYPVNVRGEITFGFISASGFRERSTTGQRDASTDSFIRIDQTLGDLIRGGHFTFLKADVLRKLRHKPVALKLYSWARTHEPNDDGFLMQHRISTLADKLGVQDTNVTRRRQKVLAALEAVRHAAPDEFPGYETVGASLRSADPTIRIRRHKVPLDGALRPIRVTAG